MESIKREQINEELRKLAHEELELARELIYQDHNLKKFKNIHAKLESIVEDRSNRVKSDNLRKLIESTKLLRLKVDISRDTRPMIKTENQTKQKKLNPLQEPNKSEQSEETLQITKLHKDDESSTNAKTDLQRRNPSSQIRPTRANRSNRVSENSHTQASSNQNAQQLVRGENHNLLPRHRIEIQRCQENGASRYHLRTQYRRENQWNEEFLNLSYFTRLGYSTRNCWNGEDRRNSHCTRPCYSNENHWTKQDRRKNHWTRYCCSTGTHWNEENRRESHCTRPWYPSENHWNEETRGGPYHPTLWSCCCRRH